MASSAVHNVPLVKNSLCKKNPFRIDPVNGTKKYDVKKQSSTTRLFFESYRL
ncbi:hypothetical protein DSUL_170011 [Desulfovibrionales bacterium]